MKKIILLILSIAVMSGCAKTPLQDSSYYAKRASLVGVLTGAGAGAVIGYQTGAGGIGAGIGGIVGLVAGLAIGQKMDKMQSEMQQALNRETKNKSVAVARVKKETLKITLKEDVFFAFDKSELTDVAKFSLSKIANKLNKFPNTGIEIDGYTDSKGSEKYNKKLSKKRAIAVMDFLIKHNVVPNRLYAEGKGESSPVADNKTKIGREQNRRVELIVQN